MYSTIIWKDIWFQTYERHIQYDIVYLLYVCSSESCEIVPLSMRRKLFFCYPLYQFGQLFATVRLYMYLSSPIRSLLQPLIVGSQGYIFLIPLWSHGIAGYYTVCHIASVCRQCRLLTLESFIDFRVNKWPQSHIHIDLRVIY